MRVLMLLTAIVVAALLSVGCGSDEPVALPQGSEPVELDPADFTTEIDNPYWPMAPGRRGSTGRPTGRGTSSESRSR